MTVFDAIHKAEALLPNLPTETGIDSRWQAIIKIDSFMDSDPEPIWQFILKHGNTSDEDLQMALSTCLLEHLLQIHPRYRKIAEQFALSNAPFSRMFSSCWL